MTSRFPPVRIETDVWAIMRYRPDQPAAMIYRITDQVQVAQYLVITWHPDPARRRMIAMFDTLEASDKSVLWESSGVTTRRESHRPSDGLRYTAKRIIDGAPQADTD